MNNMLINDALEFVRNLFHNDYSGHDHFHTLRVYKMATRIAEQENSNLIIVQLAALLHDVDDIKLSPETIEGKCVQDADRLDAMGAIGIARAFAYGGNHNRIIYDPDIKPTVNMNGSQYHNHISTTINHFYEKLFSLKDLMNTDTARRIAEQREEYMKLYISEFFEEWDGIR